MSKKVSKPSISSVLSGMSSRQTSLRSRLSDHDWQDVLELAEIMASNPRELKRVGWKAITEECRKRWGLEKLAASTLERQVSQLCDEQKKQG